MERRLKFDHQEYRANRTAIYNKSILIAALVEYRDGTIIDCIRKVR
jgi:hypothetical protein